MPGIIDLTNKKILVVEDDEMNFIYLNQVFKLTNGEITRAKNGKMAIKLAEENIFDLILMDIQLPDISGNEATRVIRTFRPKVPIIAQTASRTPDETDLALEAGCTDILIKPFTIDMLSDVISRSLEL
jgi:CheY-like chemotaxis protein